MTIKCSAAIWWSRRRLYYIAGAGVIGIVAAVVFGSPRGRQQPKKPPEVSDHFHCAAAGLLQLVAHKQHGTTQGYDSTMVPMVVVMVLMVLGALSGLGGLLQFHVSTPVYAKKVSYHADVLRQL